MPRSSLIVLVKAGCLMLMTAVGVWAVEGSAAWSQSLRDQYLDGQDSRARQTRDCLEFKRSFNYALPGLAHGYGFRSGDYSISGTGLARYRIDASRNVYALTEFSCPQVSEKSIGEIGKIQHYRDGYEQQLLMEDGQLCLYRKSPEGLLSRACFVRQVIAD